MEKIYLASGSARRKELLHNLIGNNFEVISSSYEEDNTLSLSAQEIVKLHSLGKARDAAKGLKSGIVIGSDCLLYYNGHVLGKPGTLENAKRMLSDISGQEIQAFSGIALVDVKTGMNLVDYDSAKLKIKEMSFEEIDAYVERERPVGNAAGFNIHSAGAALVEKIEGDYYSIVGMPQFKLSQLFEKMNIFIYDYKKEGNSCDGGNVK